MNSSNEQLFQSVFNCATVPMVLVKANEPRFTIITHNKQHKIISSCLDQNITAKSASFVFEQALVKGSNELDLLLNSMSLAQTNNQTVRIPALNFRGYNLSEESNLWQIEIVPVAVSSEEADCLLIIWHNILVADPDQELNDIVPVMETSIGEELFASVEQIELGNEELEAVSEELEAVNDDLVRTQKNLNTLSQNLNQTAVKQRVDGNGRVPEMESKRDRLMRYLMQASAGICILDGPDFVLEFINPSFLKMFPKRNLLSKSLLKAFPEIKGLELWGILKEVYHFGETFQGNEWLIPLMSEKDSVLENRYFNFICQARYDSDENIDGLMIFVYEVTDIVQVRLEVEENERHFQVLLNAIPQIAWTNLPNGEANFYNEQWHSYTGIGAGISHGIALSETIHPDDLNYHNEQYSSILETKENGSYEIRQKAANGNHRWFLIHMQPIKDEEEQVLFWIGTATDIHELKLLQQKKDDMINIASHELKTPVASLKASMQLLHRMKHNSSEKMQNLIDVAGRSTDKVSGLINDLLNPEQLKDGGLPLRKVCVNLFSLVKNCCETDFKDESHDIIVSGDKNVQVNVDVKRIEQVITNFVTNALKYAPESGIIHIDIKKLNDKVKVSVTDKGKGIPADQLRFLFDRYYRVAGYSDQEGLGLGLYISSEIIAKHAGKIGVESIVGQGSTFWFTLPFVIQEK